MKGRLKADSLLEKGKDGWVFLYGKYHAQVVRIGKIKFKLDYNRALAPNDQTKTRGT
jgi:hypothetical protein